MDRYRGSRAKPLCRDQFSTHGFANMLGRPPIRYLTEWRMHLAKDLLATTDLGVAAVAHRVGYDAEEAFSRAFQRSHGESPTVWRSARPMRMKDSSGNSRFSR